MKKNLSLLLASLLLTAFSNSILAQHHSGGAPFHGGYPHGGAPFHGGVPFHGAPHPYIHDGIAVGIGIPGPFFPYPYPYVPYPYYAPPANIIVETPPPQPNVQQAFWYYCENPKGYYPQIQNCNTNWIKVTPAPPPTGP